MRQYHLSYDSKDKREKILKVLIENTDIAKVESFCESTLILHFNQSQPKLFIILSNALGNDFYFVLSSISQIKDPSNDSIKDIIMSKPVPNLDDNLQIEWKDLKNKLK